jgi:hypothetical protein
MTIDDKCGGRNPLADASAGVRFTLSVMMIFRLNRQRLRANVDVYNLANASTATFIRNAYTAPDAVTSTPWLQPTQVMDGRFVKFSAQFDF